MKMFVDTPAIYLRRDFVDFRRSINGLVTIVEMEMDISPFTDAIFVFTNKKRDKLKIVYWDKTGFAMWYKRLDKNKFKWPTKVQQTTLNLSEQQLHWLLGGYDVIGHPTLHYKAVAL